MKKHNRRSQSADIIFIFYCIHRINFFYIEPGGTYFYIILLIIRCFIDIRFLLHFHSTPPISLPFIYPAIVSRNETYDYYYYDYQDDESVHSTPEIQRVDSVGRTRRHKRWEFFNFLATAAVYVSSAEIQASFPVAPSMETRLPPISSRLARESILAARIRRNSRRSFTEHFGRTRYANDRGKKGSAETEKREGKKKESCGRRKKRRGVKEQSRRRTSACRTPRNGGERRHKKKRNI